MKKTNVLLNLLFVENEAIELRYQTINSQNTIDEQRNVKQPPMLLGELNLVNKFYNPLKTCHV